MRDRLNQFLDALSEYLAARRGLIPLLGILLVVSNGLLQLLPATGWFVESQLLLHLGVVIAILGLMLAWAL